MLLNRIRSHIDDRLRISQKGFREGRSSTTDFGTGAHILGLRRIIEGINSNHLSAVITFTGFKKAFDTIHRAKMIRILRAYGIPKTITDAIEDTYTNTKAKVISPDGETKLFDILAGVLQGGTLALYLIIITLDHCLRNTISGRKNLALLLNQDKVVELSPKRKQTLTLQTTLV